MIPSSPINSNIFRIGKYLLLWLGFFLVGETVALLISQACHPVADTPTRNAVMLQAALQALFAFIAPAFVLSRMEFNKPCIALGLDTPVSARQLLAMVLAWLIGMLFLNQIIYWNAEMHLPQFLHGWEEKWRQMEEVNAAFTKTLTDNKSLWGLISGIAVVGLLTGFAEEVFFRGALQGGLVKFGIRPAWAIWTAACIFSLMHFQMFGFVPRLLLGAFFGYLYYWSSSIWLPVAAHTLNNSMVVFMQWLANNGYIHANADSYGVAESGAFPWPFLISALAFALYIYCGRKWFLPKPEVNKEFRGE